MWIRVVLWAYLLGLMGPGYTDNSLVLLWGANCTEKSILGTLRRNEFVDLMRPLVQKYMMVVFLENHLTAKDLLCINPETGASCYTHLKQARPRTYYGSVQRPWDALRSVGSGLVLNVVNQSGWLQYPIACETGRVHLISFNDSATLQPRPETLASHDYFISLISRKLNCSAVYLYMARPQDNHSCATRPRRVRRDTAKKGHFLNASNFALHFESVMFKDESKMDTSLEFTELATAQSQGMKYEVSLRMAEDEAMTFHIQTVGSYYYVKDFIYKNETHNVISKEPLMAPEGFSYACNEVVVASAKSRITWKNVQFQWFAGVRETNGSVFSFGQPWSCSGFVSIGIVSSLFVMSVITAIISCGVSWILDISTMDRFDDADGQRLAIYVTD